MIPFYHLGKHTSTLNSHLGLAYNNNVAFIFDVGKIGVFAQDPDKIVFLDNGGGE